MYNKKNVLQPQKMPIFSETLNPSFRIVIIQFHPTTIGRSRETRKGNHKFSPPVRSDVCQPSSSIFLKRRFESNRIARGAEIRLRIPAPSVASRNNSDKAPRRFCVGDSPISNERRWRRQRRQQQKRSKRVTTKINECRAEKRWNKQQ